MPLLQALGEWPDEAIQQGLRHLQTMEFLYETALFPEQVYTFKHALTHEVAYGELLQERRRELHARIAQALLERFPETAETRPELLPHHYTVAGVHEQAIRYWEKAGQRANERSAYREAVSHLTTALDLLVTLPESRARSQQELGVQMALGMALKATKGTVAAEVEQAYARARVLCEQVGEPPQLFRVLWSLAQVYRLRGEAQTTRALGEELLRLARRLHDPDLLLEAHHALWTILFYGGELAAIRPPLAQGLRLGPTALKLRPDLTESRGESVERCLCFRFSVWPWQFMAKLDEKAICERLQTGKRYRFLAEKEMSRSTLGGR